MAVWAEVGGPNKEEEGRQNEANGDTIDARVRQPVL